MTIAKAITKTLDISVEDVRIDLTATIRSYDLTDTQFIFEIKSSNGMTANLTGSTAIYIVEYVHNSQTYAIQGDIDIIGTDTLSFNLPEDLKGYSGTVLIGIYVKLTDGTKIDIKDIAVRIEPSIMDKDIDFSAKTYFKDFESVKAEVISEGEKVKTDIKAIVTDVQSVGETAKAEIKATLPSIQAEVSEIKEDIVVLSEQTKNLLDSDNIVPDVLYENVLESWGEDNSWFYNWSNKYTYNVSKSKEVLYKGFPTLSVQLSNATGKTITTNRRINLDDYIDKEVYVELGLYVEGNSIPEMAQFGIGGTVLNFDNLKSGWNFVKGTIITPSNETNNHIRLVVGGNCHVYFSPVLITYNYITRLTLGETTEEMKKELKNLSNDYAPELIFPDVIPCVADKQIMLYYDNALLYSSIKNIERIKADRNKSPYDNMVDKWFWQPGSDDASFTNAFRMYAENTKEYTQEARCWLQNVSKTSGSGKTKKCLFIGDSITQYAGYISELINLFENDEASIELLGTRESAYTDSDGTERTVRHEGRGGWSAKDYCTAESKNSVSNPFLHNGFNLAHYMANQGHSSVDYVFVMLGTNDLSNSVSETVKYFTQIYNSIKGYDSNVKVFISLCPSLSSKVDTFDMKNKRLLLTKELIKNFGGKTKSGTFLIPLYLVIDAENDFPYNESVYNATRFAKLPSYITDNAHMNKYGHYKMADLVYYTIKYAMQLFS